jgi:hypothetical protein
MGNDDARGNNPKSEGTTKEDAARTGSQGREPEGASGTV